MCCGILSFSSLLVATHTSHISHISSRDFPAPRGRAGRPQP
ncbi:MAG: hypothetical protein OXU61_03855 [Gammaproteobacteria bacterium]|nr:hypothetical protein [Gammaproteobacteria bacterium]